MGTVAAAGMFTGGAGASSGPQELPAPLTETSQARMLGSMRTTERMNDPQVHAEASVPLRPGRRDGRDGHRLDESREVQGHGPRVLLSQRRRRGEVGAGGV